MIEDETLPMQSVRRKESRTRRQSEDRDPDLSRSPQAGRRQAPSRGRRTAVLVLAVVLLLGAVIGGGTYLYSTFFTTPDFDGDGTGDVVVQVADGDSTRQIASRLSEQGVVAGVGAFVDAASDDDRVRSVQPGYYRLRERMSGAAAVARLLDPASRVGQLEIRGGVQLDDTRAPNGPVAPGVLTLISQATCAEINGVQTCVSVDDLRAAMSSTDPAELGVPAWALDDVAKAEPARRLEGLLAPGRYNVEPGASAVEVLQALLAASSARIEAGGLVTKAQSIGSSPYQVLIVASMVEKESIIEDMPKVARVIYNRLGAGRRLELDTTVNYPLDVQGLFTGAEDRERVGPYNTYTTIGLPPTPISTPGSDAIAAALAPAAGPWLYFVPCEKGGKSCFAETFAQHSENIAAARANGAI